jgi:hypothetical protein
MTEQNADGRRPERGILYLLIAAATLVWVGLGGMVFVGILDQVAR